MSSFQVNSTNISLVILDVRDTDTQAIISQIFEKITFALTHKYCVWAEKTANVKILKV